MKKKLFIGLIIIIIAALALGVILYTNNKSLSSNMALGCEVTAYEQKADAGYITFNYNNGLTERAVTAKVEDAELQKTLANCDISNIIGLQLNSTISYKVLNQHHIDIKNFYPLNILNFDKYLILQGVSFK